MCCSAESPCERVTGAFLFFFLLLKRNQVVESTGTSCSSQGRSPGGWVSVMERPIWPSQAPRNAGFGAVSGPKGHVRVGFGGQISSLPRPGRKKYPASSRRYDYPSAAGLTLDHSFLFVAAIPAVAAIPSPRPAPARRTCIQEGSAKPTKQTQSDSTKAPSTRLVSQASPNRVRVILSTVGASPRLI